MNQDTKRKLDLFYYSYLMVNNNDKEILKYKFFEESNDYYEVVLAYLLLNYQYNIRYNYGYINVPAGTLLYRIRNYKKDVDYSNISEWQAPPIKFRGQGRMNKMSEEALYLASSEELCLKETNIKKGQKYVIGLYVVTEDIKVGGFNGTNLNPKLTDIHRKIGMILNAFLIAPKRNSKNKDIFDFLESYYKDLILNDPDDIDEFDAIKLPLKFALIPYYNDCYYDITNSICEILQQQYPNGIRYSSCYKPLDTNKVLFNDYNLVLYNSGIQKIQFLKYEIRICNEDPDVLGIIKNIAKWER